MFALSADPLATGLVASLARPVGNVTGLSVQSADLASKKIEFLRQAVPNVHSLAIMANIDFPAAVLKMREAKKGSSILQLEADPVEIRHSEAVAGRQRNDKLTVCHASRIAGLFGDNTFDLFLGVYRGGGYLN